MSYRESRRIRWHGLADYQCRIRVLQYPCRTWSPHCVAAWLGLGRALLLVCRFPVPNLALPAAQPGGQLDTTDTHAKSADADSRRNGCRHPVCAAALPARKHEGERTHLPTRQAPAFHANNSKDGSIPGCCQLAQQAHKHSEDTKHSCCQLASLPHLQYCAMWHPEQLRSPTE